MQNQTPPPSNYYKIKNDYKSFFDVVITINDIRSILELQEPKSTFRYKYFKSLANELYNTHEASKPFNAQTIEFYEQLQRLTQLNNSVNKCQ